MRKLIASTFVSLDGIMQAPGGQEEDPTGGFASAVGRSITGMTASTSPQQVSTAKIASWYLGAELMRYLKRTGHTRLKTIRLRRRSMQPKNMLLRAH